jgi:DNA-directed RNA polymerase beta' subunit
MNVACTRPYNADFDGDEMNLHMPQSVLTETEIRLLAATPYQIINPGSNKPIIGIFQDSLLGSFRFTRKGIQFSPRDAMNLLMSYPHVNVNELRQLGKTVTNFDILSQITPPISLKYKTGLFDEDKDDANDPENNHMLEIYNGKYMRGQTEKSVYDSASKGILHRIYNDYGPMACADYNDALQAIVTEYMKSSSFSVGISDLIADRATNEKIVEAIRLQKMEVQTIIDKVHLGIFENTTANSNIKHFELMISNILNKATEESGKIGKKSLSQDNRFLMIVNSGSKGNLVNISQMISCLGQQAVDGKRIAYGFDDRTLPHFKKYDDSPNARGFVENSYITGLTAPELFFHAMAGRTGLIDTAVKTASTGYIQRRLVKGLEDLMVNYDMTVRNNKGKIIQFAYGDDHFDSTKIENQILPVTNLSVEDIYMHYDIPGMVEAENNLRLAIFTKEAISRMNKQKEKCRDKCYEYATRLIRDRDLIVDKVFNRQSEVSVRIPVGFQYIIQNIQGQLDLRGNSAVDITPYEAFELIEEYFEKINSIPFAKTNSLFRVLYFYYMTPRDLLIKRRFHRKALILLLETVLLRFKEALVHPGEMVGVLAAQEVGEPCTQLTLNSVIWEEKITIRNQDGKIRVVQIGQFTEEQVARSKNIQYMADKDTTYAELNPEEEYYEVPGANEAGETVWRRIEAVTQHPVVNEDGTNTMLRVTTKGGRVVTATKAKSFLQLIDGKILPVAGKDLKVGDYLPVSVKPLDFKAIYTLDLREILPPTEYIYGTEFAKAVEVMGEYHWWTNHQGKTFTLPYTRSDGVTCRLLRLREGTSSLSYEPGLVYTKSNTYCNYRIPEQWDLDYDFGYTMGAYCAEGCTTRHQISIANNDPAYFAPIIRLCERYNLTYKMYTHNDKNQKGWTSSDMRIYSTLLTRILTALGGKLSHLKFVSPHIVFSNRECMLGFLDAYIGGDGCIQKDNNKVPHAITIASTSKPMLIDVMVMLRNLGVKASIGKTMQMTHNNRGTAPDKIQPFQTLYIGVEASQKLAPMLNLLIEHKQASLQQIIQRKVRPQTEIFPNIVDGVVIKEPRNDRMPDLIFVPITEIEEVPNTRKHVYDLTVEDTRNFDLYHGLTQNDTFHSSGIASKSNVTRGVPRIEEILRLTKNPKNPSMTVYIKPMDETDQDKAIQYATRMTHTRLIDVVQSVQVCFDPNPHNTQIPEDQLLLEQFFEFENMVEECLEAGAGPDTSRSKWIIRMEMDQEALIDKNITMDDIHFAIANSEYGKDVQCVFSDHNMDKLIFRIRTNSSVFDKSTKKTRGLANPLDQSDEIYILKNFQDTLLHHIVLRGVNGVQNILPRKIQNSMVKENDKYVKKETWVLDTTGSNLLETLALPYIDNRRTISTDIKEVYHVLGIEAARQCIHNEMVEVLGFSGASVNYHHLSVLCDRMTCNKGMVSIYRSGLLNDNVGPIAKATFEVHTEVFLSATRHAEMDHMRGVSANIMCGQYGAYGTNSCQVLLDMKAFEHIKSAPYKRRNVKEEIERGMAQAVDTPADCTQIEIQNNIVNIRHTNDQTTTCYDDGYNLGF